MPRRPAPKPDTQASPATPPHRVRKAARSVQVDGPDQIDLHVGSRVRLLRTLHGMSQTDLGKAVGLSFQQVQKYERGMNRVSASKLWALSKVLNVPVSYFFDGINSDKIAAFTEEPFQITIHAADMGILNNREIIELARAYWSISDPTLRRTLYDLFKATAKADAVSAPE